MRELSRFYLSFLDEMVDTVLVFSATEQVHTVEDVECIRKNRNIFPDRLIKGGFYETAGNKPDSVLLVRLLSGLIMCLSVFRFPE